LPCRFRCRSRGALLPHRFTLAGINPGGLFSVALSLRLPSPDVIRHRISVEPGLSSIAETTAIIRPTGLQRVRLGVNRGQAWWPKNNFAKIRLKSKIYSMNGRIIPAPAKVDTTSVTRLRIYLALLLVALASSAKAQEREWTLDRTDQDVFLVFGTPETDDVGVSFWCRIGSKKLRLFLPVESKPAAYNTSLMVTIHGHEFTLPVAASQNEMTDGNTLEAEFEVTSPMVKALQDNNYFIVAYAGAKSSFPLVNADTAGLIRLCTEPPVDP
jgi:hypothetical protein